MILQFLKVKFFFRCVAFFLPSFSSLPLPSENKSFTEIRAGNSNQKREFSKNLEFSSFPLLSDSRLH